MPTTTTYTDVPYIYCTQADVERWASVLGLQLRLDDDRSGTLASPETLYEEGNRTAASADVNSYVAKRYDPLAMSNSYKIVDMTAVIALWKDCAHRFNPIPDSLQEAYDQALSDLEDIRNGKQDLAGIPERDPAAPGIINIGIDLRYPDPYRVQTQQSTTITGRRPHPVDYLDQVRTNSG